MKQTSVFKEVWKDEKFAALSNDGKLFALYCLTNQNLTLIPIYKWFDRETLYDLGISAKTLDNLKKEVTPLGICFYEGFCCILTSFKPFSFKGEKLDGAIDTKYHEIPEKVLEFFLKNTSLIPYRYPIDTSNNSNINSNSKSTNKSSSKDNNKERPSFDEMMSSYHGKTKEI